MIADVAFKVLTPYDSRQVIGDFLAATGGPGNSSYPVANMALFIPVVNPVDSVATRIHWLSGTGTGLSVDVGIYDWQGNRMVSSGPVAQATNTLVTADITDTPLPAGKYFLAFSHDTTGIAFYSWAIAGSNGYPTGRVLGLKQMASAYPLPATATFANFDSQRVPAMAVELT